MSVSMIHESNVTALPAEDEYEADSIIMVIGQQTSCVHYDEGEHECIELILMRPGNKYAIMTLQTDGPMRRKI